MHDLAGLVMGAARRSPLKLEYQVTAAIVAVVGAALVASACLETPQLGQPRTAIQEKLNARLSWADVPDEAIRLSAASAVDRPSTSRRTNTAL